MADKKYGEEERKTREKQLVLHYLFKKHKNIKLEYFQKYSLPKTTKKTTLSHRVDISRKKELCFGNLDACRFQLYPPRKEIISLLIAGLVLLQWRREPRLMPQGQERNWSLPFTGQRGQKLIKSPRTFFFVSADITIH